MSDDFYRPSPTEFAASAVSPFMEIARKVYLGEAGGDEKEYAILGVAHVLKREFERVTVTTVNVSEREFYGGTAVPAPLPADGGWVNGVSSEDGQETANSVLTQQVADLQAELDKAYAITLTQQRDLDRAEAQVRLTQVKLEQVYAREDQLTRDLNTKADMYERARVAREAMAYALLEAKADMAEMLTLYRLQAERAYLSGGGRMFYCLNEREWTGLEREDCARRAKERFPYVSESFRAHDDIVTRYNDIARKYADGRFLIPVPDPPAVETEPNQD